MDEADHQTRSHRARPPIHERTEVPVLTQPPALAQRPAKPKCGQRLLAAATVAASLSVGLNAFVQALNVLAAWWGHQH